MTKKKVNKKAKRRIVVFFLIFSIIALPLGYSLFLNIEKIVKIKEEESSLNDKLANLEEEETSLNSDIKKLEDPEYVAKYAREKYLYSKDGEIVIRLPEDD